MTGKEGVLLSNGLFLSYGEKHIIKVITDDGTFIGEMYDLGNDAISIYNDIYGTLDWWLHQVEDIQLVS